MFFLQRYQWYINIVIFLIFILNILFKECKIIVYFSFLIKKIM